MTALVLGWSLAAIGWAGFLGINWIRSKDVAAQSTLAAMYLLVLLKQDFLESMRGTIVAYVLDNRFGKNSQQIASKLIRDMIETAWEPQQSKQTMSVLLAMVEE